MRGDRVGELARILDLVDRDQHLRRDLLVELDVLLELADHRARQRFEFLTLAAAFRERSTALASKNAWRSVKPSMRARWPPSTSTFTVPSGSFSSCSTVEIGADGEDVLRRRIVLRGVLLRDQQDLLVVLHHVLERADGLLAPDEQRHDHVREDDDVPQRQDRDSSSTGWSRASFPSCSQRTRSERGAAPRSGALHRMQAKVVAETGAGQVGRAWRAVYALLPTSPRRSA